MVKRFLSSRLSGIYFSVVQEGEIAAQDAIELSHREEHSITVADIVQIYLQEADENLVVSYKFLPWQSICENIFNSKLSDISKTDRPRAILLFNDKSSEFLLLSA